MACKIIQIPMLKDNYSYLVHDSVSNITAIIDPSTAEPAMAIIDQHGGKLDYILNTHHHHDHTDGNHKLKRHYGARVLAGMADRGRISDLDEGLNDHQTIAIGSLTAKVFFTPGHTKGHVVYWFEQNNALFCGDTLFSLGCGAIFEGTTDQMWQSMQIIRQLPDATQVYCAHEYTDYFVNFALSLEPDRPELIRKKEQVTAKRLQSIATVPSLLGEEKSLNPFLRADDPQLCAKLGLRREITGAAAFAHLIKLDSDF